MRRDLFESFYKGNIEIIAKRVVQQNPDFSYKENLNGIYEEYLNQKTGLKYLIKSQYTSGDEKDSNLIDGHKISACITCAILKVRIIVNNSINDDMEKECYSLDRSYRLNEQVALLSGLSCLLEFMADDPQYLYMKNQDAGETKLQFPKTKYEDKSAYFDSLVRALYYSNIGTSINPLLLSHIYFLIEQYHRKYVELEELKYSLKRSGCIPSLS